MSEVIHRTDIVLG